MGSFTRQIETLEQKLRAGKEIYLINDNNRAEYLFQGVIGWGTSPTIRMRAPDGSSEVKSAADWRRAGFQFARGHFRVGPPKTGPSRKELAEQKKRRWHDREAAEQARYDMLETTGELYKGCVIRLNRKANNWEISHGAHLLGTSRTMPEAEALVDRFIAAAPGASMSFRF